MPWPDEPNSAPISRRDAWGGIAWRVLGFGFVAWMVWMVVTG